MGGSQKARVIAGRGEPSSVTATAGAPTSRSAACPGLAMVADAVNTTGLDP